MDFGGLTRRWQIKIKHRNIKLEVVAVDFGGVIKWGRIEEKEKGIVKVVQT